MFLLRPWGLLCLVSVVFLLAHKVGAFSVSSPSTEYDPSVYHDQSEARYAIDQAAYESSDFWKQVDDCLGGAGWKQRSDLKRFQGFCRHLQTERPGEESVLENGQQLLNQYIFPGLEPEDGVQRTAYPASQWPELHRLQQRLKRQVMPVARQELTALLDVKPLVSDDEEFAGLDENDGDTWQRAAWYGWQFLSLRGARSSMPDTTKALTKAMQDSGPAHRFVGLARQKQQCKGTEHSDGRNYMVSTLTPLQCPPGCGIVVDGQTADIVEGGDPVVLDNTFVHHVFNNGDTDRYCLMSECWHPALSLEERQAIATLFAAKDRFTVTDLALAPWGYDDDSLEYALSTGAVNDLEFWRDLGYDRRAKTTAGSSSLDDGKKKKKKKSSRSKQRKASGSAKGFGARS